MKWQTLAAIMLVATAITGCDKAPLNKIPWEKVPFLGKKDTAAPPPVAIAQDSTPQGPADSAAPQAPVAVPEPAPEPERPPAPVTRAPAMIDEPWTPTDTGTVAPGMTREEVIAVWGIPVAERQDEAWTYLYFRNGCEYTCGMLDVVFLQNGQVVDAVVRGPGHTYAGASSSPADRPAEATPPAPNGAV